MKRVVAGTFVAAACVVGLAAQAPPAQPPQSAPPMQEAKDAAKSVTVTGCLKSGEGTDSFLLSNLKWTQDKAVGTSGAVAPAAPAISATSLKLTGSPSTKFSDHVGHTVEISGTIDKADKDKTATDPAARPADAQASINVRNLKMVAATCQAE
jgi:hypothetical protein